MFNLVHYRASSAGPNTFRLWCDKTDKLFLKNSFVDGLLERAHEAFSLTATGPGARTAAKKTRSDGPFEPDGMECICYTTDWNMRRAKSWPERFVENQEAHVSRSLCGENRRKDQVA